MVELFTLNGFFSLFTLIILEISLGIDNIIFISMFVARIDPRMRDKVRAIGLSLALVLRVIMLFSITWIISLDTNPVNILGWELTVKDIILIAGGLFLIFKTTREIHTKFNPEQDNKSNTKRASNFFFIIGNIILIDFIFSFDSILTAIGLTRNILIMIIAVVVAMVIMFFFSKAINNFLDKNIPFQVLALAFLVMIGFVLMLEGFGQQVSKGYIYFSMLFSFSVELLNMRLSRKQNKTKN